MLLHECPLALLEDDGWRDTGVPDDEALWHLVPRERLNEGSEGEGVNVVGTKCTAEIIKVGADQTVGWNLCLIPLDVPITTSSSSVVDGESVSG